MLAPYIPTASPSGDRPDDGNTVSVQFLPHTNAIESPNARFRQALRHRSHFPHEQSALNVLYLVAKQRVPNKKNPIGVGPDWEIILNELTMH
jgi:transposase-like protein